MFPCYLRDAGYYCTNNAKEDYNLEHTGKVWDESSAKAHYRNRKAGQPFFAVFNNLVTHESQIRVRPHTWIHNPAEARVPAYHPDTQDVRQDWAQYYDNITEMDTWFGRMLQELQGQGLANDTIVFFYGDHGSGMPRSKRWPYNSGLHVPLLVHIPEKFRRMALRDYKPGGTSDRLVSFVDLAPTVLSLAGLKPQAFHQGHAFLGPQAAPEQPYVYGFRGRMDERYDMVRSVRDKRYVYVRNYMPDRIYGQHLAYMFETPTTRVWSRLNAEGKLNAAQKAFWNPKPAEELYDLTADRDEIHNLASDAAHAETLARLRQAQRDLAAKIRDIGFLPEGEIHSRSARSTPYEAGHDPARYPFERIFAAAEAATKDPQPAQLQSMLADRDSAVRYWAAIGYRIAQQHAALRPALADPSPYVRITAAETIGRFGNDDDLRQAIQVLLELAPADRNGMFVALMALNAVDQLGPRAASAKAAIRALPKEITGVHQRFQTYIPRVIEHILTS